MPSDKWRRDLRIFSLGIALGILGNLLVEFWFAWMFPDGIPQMDARNWTIAIVVTIMLYLIYTRKILKND